jgi:type VI protein secretion system component VasF
MATEPAKQVLTLMLVLLGFNTMAVATSIGYSFSLQHQLDKLEQRILNEK